MKNQGGSDLLLRILDRLEEILIASLMGAATVLIFIAVVHRYSSGVPFLYPLMHQIHLSWAQELCIYMFVWMAKFGAAYGVRTGIHVGVDVLVNKLDERLRKKVILFGLLLRRAVHRHRRRHGHEVRDRPHGHGADLARPRAAELARLSRRSRSARR